MQSIQHNIEQRLVDYKQSINKDDEDEIDWSALGQALDDAQEELAELGEDIDADELDAMAAEAEAEGDGDGDGDGDSDFSDDNGFREEFHGEGPNEEDGEEAREGEGADGATEGRAPDGGLWAMFDEANWHPGVWNAARLPRTP
jgi:hypothetical protein